MLAVLAPLFLVFLVTRAFVTGAVPAAAATPPPWEASTQPGAKEENGGIAFYDASGNPITGGSVGATPIAAFALGGAPAVDGDTKATLYGCTPQFAVDPVNWSCEALSSSTLYPNANAPGALATTSLPLVTGSAKDESFDAYISDIPNTDTTDAGYVNVYQLRIATSGASHAVDFQKYKYDAADIQVTGGSASDTWQLVYTLSTPSPGGTSASTPPASTSPTTSSSSTTNPGGSPTDTATTSATPTVSASGSSAATATASASATSSATSSTGAHPTSSSTATGLHTVGILAKDGTGATLGSDPTLLPGDVVTLQVGGFAPKETVRAVVHPTPRVLASVTSDPTGTVTYRFTVPSGLAAGRHSLVLTGGSTTASWAFTVGTDAAGRTSGSSLTGATTGRRLASTGAPVTTWLLLAAATLWSGCVLVLFGRRRPGHAVAGARHRRTPERGGRHRREAAS